MIDPSSAVLASLAFLILLFLVAVVGAAVTGRTRRLPRHSLGHAAFDDLLGRDRT